MNYRSVAGVALSLLVVAGGFAGEWSEWETIPGGIAPEGNGDVRCRYRRNEDSDDSSRGYMYFYEIKNFNTEHKATIYLAFDTRDSKTGAWTPAGSVEPGITELKPGRSTTPLAQRTQGKEFIFSSGVIWDDEKKAAVESEKKEFAVEKESNAPADGNGGSPSNPPAPKKASTEPPTAPAGKLAETSDPLSQIIKAKIENSPNARFMVLMDILRPDQSEDVDSWHQTILDLLFEFRDSKPPASLLVTDSNSAGMKVEFKVVYGKQLQILISEQTRWRVRINGWMRLPSGGAENKPR